MPSLRMLEHLFDVMPVGVVMMDERSRIIFYNRYEEELAGRSRHSVLGKRFFDEVAPCVKVAGLGERYMEQVGDGTLDYEMTFRFPRPNIPRPRDVRLVMSAMPMKDGAYGALFVEDITAVRAIERTKDFLVQALAHDLNNPLAVASSLLELMQLDGPLGREQMLQNAMLALDRMRSMIIGLFDVTRLHSGRIPLSVQPVDLRTIVQEAVEDESAAASARGVRFVGDDSQEPMLLEADAQLVRRAVTNLLENAVRYTPRDGTVKVRLSRKGNAMTCEVRDDGPGIPEELRDKIFQPFVTGGDAFVAPRDHRGIGLAFVDLVAREHGGSVTLHCPETGGSVFTLVLPRVHSPSNYASSA